MPLNLPTYGPDWLDRDEIMEHLKARLPDILHHLFPAGRVRGNHFEIGNIRGEKGQSLKVTLHGDRAGLWHDFESDDGGDIFSLWAKCHGMDTWTQFTDVLKSMSDWLGTTPTLTFSPTIRQEMAWHYLDISGQVIASVHRYDMPLGKTYRPWDAKAQKWQMPTPRPLYNLPGIAVSPCLVLVEGEKAAQALIDYGVHATTAMGGASAPTDKTDWSPLKGKAVIIWPDNDAAGRKYMEAVSKALTKAGAASIDILTPPAEKPEKWDAANAVEEGMDIMTFLGTAKSMEISASCQVYSLESLLNDRTPVPDDLISKRVLTPGGMLVIGGAPKVGKSDFVLSLLVHMAAGESFLDFKPARPLRIVYLQAEIQKPYLIERLRNMNLTEDQIQRAKGNLFITPQMKLLLNEDGIEAILRIIRDSFGNVPPDVIVIDPIRNMFDGGPEDGGLGENDNKAMMFFLQQRVERLRDEVNPDAGMVLVHHTRKLNKTQFREDPFQALSGASSLRGYYTSALLIFRPDEEASTRQLIFELRNGPPVSTMYIDKIGDRWHEVDKNNVRLIRDQYGRKLDAERHRKHDAILEILHEEAAQGRLYTMNQFAETFEGRAGLGSKSTVRERTGVLMTKGYIKCYRRPHPLTGTAPMRSKYGFLCVEGMMLGRETIDPETGEIVTQPIPILPTDYSDSGSKAILPVENPDIWVYPDVSSGKDS